MHTKPTSCLAALQQELAILRSLDDKNQAQFPRIAGSGGKGLTKPQMVLLSEAVFFAAFRSYEQFLRNIFLLYCCGRQPSRRKRARSYMNPRSLKHAEVLVKSSMPFLDWSSPDTLVARSKTFLKDGYPVQPAITSNIERLRDLKKIRNHIAHMSGESLQEFEKVVKKHFGTLPLIVPRPGEYLLLPSKKNNYYLREHLDTIEGVAVAMT